MTTKKKILSISVAAILAVTAAVGGTLAFFTDTQSKENVITVGNVKIDLTEPQWDATGSKEAEDVYPGEALAKDPTVKNVGTNPCFVRISVSALDQFGSKGMITYRTDYVEGKLGENWELNQDDGYFYYTGVLAAGEETDALFDQIVMPVGLVGGEEAQPIVVTAEAVQAQGAKPSFADVQTMTVAEIAAWFATCGM